MNLFIHTCFRVRKTALRGVCTTILALLDRDYAETGTVDGYKNHGIENALSRKPVIDRVFNLLLRVATTNSKYAV